MSKKVVEKAAKSGKRGAAKPKKRRLRVDTDVKAGTTYPATEYEFFPNRVRER